MDAAKVLNGPITMICYTGETETLKVEGVKKDVLSLNTEDEVEELEDRTSDLIGRTGTAELTTSELDGTDFGKVKDTIDKVEFLFPNKSKKVTFTKPATVADGLGWMVRPKVDNGKTKITVKVFVPGDNMPFTIGAIT